MGGEVQIRVAGIVAFLVMKSLALAERAKPKDAYDIHFCLENYPDRLAALANECRRFEDDPLLQEALQKLAAKFRSEEDDGPRMVADVEEVIGDARAIRKLAIYTRVSDFLALCMNAR
jgi:predicted nucleotidyltransferase